MEFLRRSGFDMSSLEEVDLSSSEGMAICNSFREFESAKILGIARCRVLDTSGIVDSMLYWHGARLSTLSKIVADGRFIASSDGLLGPGVYATHDSSMAVKYSMSTKGEAAAVAFVFAPAEMPIDCTIGGSMEPLKFTVLEGKMFPYKFVAKRQRHGKKTTRTGAAIPHQIKAEEREVVLGGILIFTR